jgi:hypothetical protein
VTEPLEELWGRFDLDFPNNRSFLTMPAEDAVRSQAYLLLLAMSGWSVLHKTDGEVPMAVAGDLAQRLWPRTGAGVLLKALCGGAKLAKRTSRGYLLKKQAKWQRTRAEVNAAVEAGRRGATKRWGQRGEPNRVAHQPIGDPIAEREREQRENRERTSSLIVLRTAGLSEALEAALHSWGAKGQVTAQWRRDEDRLLRLDKRDPAEAQAVLAWATQDAFWRPNIRSIPKFREKYDALRGQMQRPGNGSGPPKGRAGQLIDYYTEQQARLAMEEQDEAR